MLKAVLSVRRLMDLRTVFLLKSGFMVLALTPCSAEDCTALTLSVAGFWWLRTALCYGLVVLPAISSAISLSISAVAGAMFCGGLDMPYLLFGFLTDCYEAFLVACCVPCDSSSCIDSVGSGSPMSTSLILAPCKLLFLMGCC